MNNARFSPRHCTLSVVTWCVLVLLVTSEASASIIYNFALDANAGVTSEFGDPGSGLEGSFLRLYELLDGTAGETLTLEANTDYTFIINFLANQAVKVDACACPSGFEDVALNFFYPLPLPVSSPGSASGTATLDGVAGNYLGATPSSSISDFFFPNDAGGFGGFYILGAEQNLTDSSFLFTGVSFQFTTGIDFNPFTTPFASLNLGGGGFEVVSVSEPGTLALLASGLLLFARRRKAIRSR